MKRKMSAASGVQSACKKRKFKYEYTEELKDKPVPLHFQHLVKLYLSKCLPEAALIAINT